MNEVKLPRRSRYPGGNGFFFPSQCHSRHLVLPSLSRMQLVTVAEFDD